MKVCSQTSKPYCDVLWCNVPLGFPWFSLSFKSKEAMQKSLMRSITTRLVLVQSSIQSFVSFVACTKTYSIVSFHWIKIVTGNRQNDNRTQNSTHNDVMSSSLQRKNTIQVNFYVYCLTNSHSWKNSIIIYDSSTLSSSSSSSSSWILNNSLFTLKKN